ncbi:MAG TPA: ABC transporter ATP-binding protein [Gaiellaceae bacterium]
MSLLRASGVARRYGGVEALAPTDVELAAGETVALVGPNGAGKSTLLAILAGALEPSAGSVECESRVGWVPQRPAHYARLTARENLVLFARLARADADVDALLDRFDLPDDRISGNLSIGNRQRLNIALSLLDDPHVLLLDEPTASLDPEQRARVWEIVEDLRRRGGAVCFATHDLDDVGRATRVVTLREGRVV